MNKIRVALVPIAVLLSVISIPAFPVRAAGADFSLQVSPSPLVATLKPGTSTRLELKVRNAGNTTENLKIIPHGFTYDTNTGKITLHDGTPADIASWVALSSPTLSISPGQWATEGVTISLPKDTGFSYSFALVISRQSNAQALSGQSVNGSVAVFTLINVDRPGATRKLTIKKATSRQGVYEYLPATFDVTLENTGNSIVQPFGNIYIQRSSNDASPISALTLNDMHGYILPGTSRTFTSTWSNGFPAYRPSVNKTGQATQSLVWDWSKLSDFRLGSYTAKIVAVYNDGKRDIPLESNAVFWVLPWKILLGFLILVALLMFGLWSLFRGVIRRAKRMPRL